MQPEAKEHSRFQKSRLDIKIVVVGSSGTGKTSFCNQWMKGVFTDEYKTTIMSEFSNKMYNYNGNYYRVQIWDLAGQDKNIYTSKVFTKDAHGCLILCDVTQPETLENTLKWKKAVDENTKFIDGSILPIILVQNKMDLVEGNNQESEEVLKSYVDNNNFLTFTRTSCKNNENINETMDFLLKNIIDRLEEYYKKQNKNLDENQRNTSIVQQNVIPGNQLIQGGFKLPVCC